MSVKCPICGSEYEEGTINFCKVCMYSIGTDRFLTDLLNHPSEEDLEVYNAEIEEYRALWRERNPEKRIVRGCLLDMVAVEGGTFTMGSDAGSEAEKPPHQVTVSSFLIGKYQVTQELWESVMVSNPSKFKGSKRPVESVTWYDVVEFCNKLSDTHGLQQAYTINTKKKDQNNRSEFDDIKWEVTCNFEVNGYRLPTEAEWEYAAKGGINSKGFKYSGSDDINEAGWYDNNSEDKPQYAGSKKPNIVRLFGPLEGTTHEVGTKKANELGIHDMSGNVSEWCWDWESYYRPANKINPHGPDSGFDRVNRGGCCYYSEDCCRVASRGNDTPDSRDSDLGFRLVRTKI